MFDQKVFYCFVDNECICLQCDEEGMLQVEDVYDLYGAHDEADTRVAFHAVHVEQLNSDNIVIRCNDKDILIIMLSNIQKFSQCHVWLDMGLYYNKSRTFIDVKGTADKLNFIQALPGIYAFTGCDCTPAFFRKGKKRPIEIILKSILYINTFNKMEEEDLSDEDIDEIESFTCSMFGYSKLTSINEARYLHFKSKCKPKEAAKPLDCLKNVNPSTLLDSRFELIDNYVHVKWFDGEQVPQGAEDDGDAVMEHSGNEYVEEEGEVTDDEVSENGDSDGDDDDEDDMDDQD